MMGGLSSCADFLEIEPQNEILFENFWNEKADVDGIVAGIYSGMQSDAILTRMIIWGEGRSENMVAGVGIEKDINLENVLKENLKSNNWYTYWADFYTIINNCNTVIKYAPLVAERDISYTESELKATIAEVTAIRELCYFYLIRAFRDVPYSEETYTDDDQVTQLPATSFNVVLDHLIANLEAVKGDAVKKYPVTKKNYQTGRVTQDFIHALLCEMYLWKKDYVNCIRYADLVIDAKIAAKKEKDKENGASMMPQANDFLKGYPLAKEFTRQGSSQYGNAYGAIFGTGNSDESIFELNFVKDNDNMLSNAAVSVLYGNAKNMTGRLKPSTLLADDVKSSLFGVYDNKFDARSYEAMNFGASSINKFVSQMVTISDPTSSNLSVVYSGIYPENKVKSNWIIYRLTDIMLMKAEALVQTVVADDENTATKLQEAFELVDIVNKRALCLDDVTAEKNKDYILSFSDYNSKLLMNELILKERHREFMFEGKRWFDLVRWSQRDGNTDVLRQMALRKYTTNSSVISNKLSKMDAIYWPYNRDELKVNRLLKQNPAYGSGDEEGEYEKTN
jgi:hypothetical protein